MMIVRDEEPIIRACLDAALPWVQAAAIVDTGSQDATREIVRERVAGMRGGLIERPWVDFATNRNQSLTLARETGADYAICLDAHDVLHAEPGAFDGIVDDAYSVEMGPPTCRWWAPRLLRLAVPWSYVGERHAVPMCEGARPPMRLRGVTITLENRGKSARAQKGGRFFQDVEVLSRVVEQRPSDARAVFYLAQSYRDAGRPEEALRWYAKRAEMGGWVEERFYSLWHVAVLMERLGRDWDAEVMPAYLTAYACRPSRPGPLVELARHYRCTRAWPLALMFARQAAALPPCDDSLFVDRTAEWRAHEELALASYYTGEYAAAGKAALAALAHPDCVGAGRERLLTTVLYVDRQLRAVAA